MNAYQQINKKGQQYKSYGNFSQNEKSMFNYSTKCGGLSRISVQQNIKYLALNIDNKLNFKEHIKIVELKVVCSVGNFAKSKYYRPQDIYYCDFTMPQLKFI